ncbi:MAG: carbohydrate ABC transporter permease [Oscillospiraceae bacterium]
MEARNSIKGFLKKDKVASYVFVMPFIIGFLAFTLVPILASLVFSFTKYDLLSPPQFVGLDNYITMFTKDKTFAQSFWVTMYYTFISVPMRLVMALVVAMLLNRKSKAVGIYRAVFYLPSIMGGSIAVAVLWRRLFAQNGVVNSILQAVGIDSQISWLGNTDTAIWTLILLSMWQFGSSMLIFLSGLKQIPPSLYEAAEIDGSSRLQKFFKITLPMLTPVIFFNLVMQMINGFMAFTQSFVITEGKPLNTTLFYSVYMYQRSFGFYEMGYGCALAWFMLLIVGLFTILLFKSSDRWVYYETKGE